jgi:hypothetical protein
VRITSNEEEPPLTSTESLDRTSRLVALVMDGMDLQMLALALPSISTISRCRRSSLERLARYAVCALIPSIFIQEKLFRP